MAVIQSNDVTYHTDRVPRTLNEAFGPYAKLDTGPRVKQPTKVEIAVSILSVIGLIIFLTALFHK